MGRKAKAELPDMDKLFGKQLTGYSCGYGLIDRVSGVPGVLFPNAVAVELYGQKSSGKTTLVLETIAYNQIINETMKRCSGQRYLILILWVLRWMMITL